jgi:hypothetical protein
MRIDPYKPQNTIYGMQKCIVVSSSEHKLWLACRRFKHSFMQDYEDLAVVLGNTVIVIC